MTASWRSSFSSTKGCSVTARGGYQFTLTSKRIQMFYKLNSLKNKIKKSPIGIMIDNEPSSIKVYKMVLEDHPCLWRFSGKKFQAEEKRCCRRTFGQFQFSGSLTKRDKVHESSLSTKTHPKPTGGKVKLQGNQ